MRTLIAFIIGALAGVGLIQVVKSGRSEPVAAAPAPVIAEAAPTPNPVNAPAYLIVLGEVYDREAFMSGYAAKLAPVYEKFGGEYVAMGRNHEVLEGTGSFSSYVVSKWPSMDAARAFWNSEDYAPLRDARIENNWGRFDVYLVEGLPAAAAD